MAGTREFPRGDGLVLVVVVVVVAVVDVVGVELGDALLGVPEDWGAAWEALE